MGWITCRYCLLLAACRFHKTLFAYLSPCVRYCTTWIMFKNGTMTISNVLFCHPNGMRLTVFLFQYCIWMQTIEWDDTSNCNSKLMSVIKITYLLHSPCDSVFSFVMQNNKWYIFTSCHRWNHLICVYLGFGICTHNSGDTHFAFYVNLLNKPETT